MRKRGYVKTQNLTTLYFSLNYSFYDIFWKPFSINYGKGSIWEIIPISISFLTNTCKEISSHIQIEMFCSEILGYFIPELRE
jgi:hypothetical protein